MIPTPQPPAAGRLTRRFRRPAGRGRLMRGRQQRGAAVVAVGLSLGLSLGLTLGGCAGQGDPADPTFLGTVTTYAPAQRGEPIELTGTTFEGQSVDISQWRGQVVVLNLWYSSCPPCRQEAPELAQVAGDFPSVYFLGINGTDDAATVAAFDKTFSTPYPSLDDADGKARAALAGVVSLQAYPTTVVLDGQGKVAGRVLGALDASTLRGLIEEAGG